jgi:putative phage-type endonuclease
MTVELITALTERNDFHAERRTGIGGSDAAAAIGISPWRTPYDLWLDKIGEAEDLTPSEPMVWGSLLEPVIAAEYSRRTARTIEAPQEMLRHPRYPWMIGHLDRRVIGEPRIVECKTAGTRRGWGEPGTDEVPLHYLVQVHHYLIVSGAEFADIAVLIGGSDFRLYEVRRDDDIARSLIDQEHAFWRRVEAHEPPAPVNLADALHRWGGLARAGAVVAGEAEMMAIVELRQTREARAALEVAEAAAKLIVLQALAARGDTLIDAAGDVLASWRLDRGRKAYQVAARPPSRRFLLRG